MKKEIKELNNILAESKMEDTTRNLKEYLLKNQNVWKKIEEKIKNNYGVIIPLNMLECLDLSYLSELIENLDDKSNEKTKQLLTEEDNDYHNTCDYSNAELRIHKKIEEDFNHRRELFTQLDQAPEIWKSVRKYIANKINLNESQITPKIFNHVSSGILDDTFKFIVDKSHEIKDGDNNKSIFNVWLNELYKNE